MRKNHNIIFAGKVSESDKNKLSRLAKNKGIESDEITFTGYISDEYLIRLYNIAKLFIFPSLHEGFGLPVLEAMACGCPVIGSNTASVPEVIGFKDVLFDPFDIKSISEKMFEILTNETLRNTLKNML